LVHTDDYEDDPLSTGGTSVSAEAWLLNFMGYFDKGAYTNNSALNIYQDAEALYGTTFPGSFVVTIDS
jgi:hypothetical protein